MSRRRTAPVAWSLGGFGLGCVIAAAVLFAAGGHRVHVLYGNEIAIAVGFCGVGAVLAARVPANALGWLMLGTGVVHAAGLASIEYLSWLGPHRVPDAPSALVVFAEVSWLPGFLILFTFVPLLFPAGRPGSRAERRLAWTAAAAMLVVVFGVVTNTKTWPDFKVPNPGYAPAVAFLGAPAFPIILATVISCVGVMVRRYRRSHGIQRQQLRWFAWSAAVASVVVGIEIAINAHNAVTTFLQFVVVFAVPVSIGVAVLRYRLYDIDRVISRTVTYALVTALLGAPYVALSLLASRIGRGSSITVAALTLVALAMLRPLRRRTQALVDRRFNRERYDAVQTVDAFAVRLRDAVDPDVVRRDLIAVTAQAVQPATMSLWVAP